MVYFIQQKNGGPIKIGSSVHPLLRLKQIRAHSPVEVELIAAIEGSAKLERELHAKFADNRLHGEWFTSTEELVSYIKDIGLPEDLGKLPDYNSGNTSLCPYREK